MILSRMLSRIPNSLDKREGSIIFDALAPAAYEEADWYKMLEFAYRQTFVETAEGQYLDMKANELGIYRQQPVAAVRKGIFIDANDAPFDVPLGSRFSTLDGPNSLNFVVSEKIADGVFRLICEDTGAKGNNYIGVIEALESINGLAGATMTDIIIPGEEIESDEDLRQRVKEYVRSNVQDGNVAQYYAWAADYTGLGRVKVFPLWNGVNTVKVSILDSLNTVANAELIADFQEYLDPSTATSFTGDGTTTVFTVAHKPRYLNLVTVNGAVANNYTYEPTDGSLTFTTAPAAGAAIVARDHGGLGNGVAPIGAVVTVTTARELAINVSASLTLTDGYTLDQAKAEIEELLAQFMNDLGYTANRVNYIELGARMLQAVSIDDISNLLINDGIVNISLGDEEIPVLGTLTLTEAI